MAADFYFNVYTHSQKAPAVKVVETKAPETASKPAETQKAVLVPENSAFEIQTYRDGRFGFEFQYPVAVKDAAQCPKIEKTDDGFSMGMFSFSLSAKNVPLADFVESELQGMTIDSRNSITVAGQPATKADYQTGGMGWSGSDTFIEHNGKIFEFGLLANESSAKCGGADDYEDQVYQAVISTLKFDN